MEQNGINIEEINGNEFCITCHEPEAVVAATADWDYAMGANPHKSHIDETQDLACNSCHQFHSSADTLYCNECHDFELPEGWIAPPTSPEAAQASDAEGDEV